MADNSSLHNPYQTPDAEIVAPPSAAKPRPVLGVLAGYGILFVGKFVTSFTSIFLMRNLTPEKTLVTLGVVSPAMHFLVYAIAAYACARLARRLEYIPVTVLFFLMFILSYVVDMLFLPAYRVSLNPGMFILPLVAMLVGGGIAWRGNRKRDEKRAADLQAVE